MHVADLDQQWQCVLMSPAPSNTDSLPPNVVMPESPEPNDSSNQNQAARELRKVLLVANKMTIVDSAQRQILFELTKAPIHSLLQLNDLHFEKSPQIRGSIALLASALLKVRNLGDGKIETLGHEHPIDCPFCDTKITRLTAEDVNDQSDNHDDPDANQWYVFCGQCSEEYTLALAKLSSQESGFGVATE